MHKEDSNSYESSQEETLQLLRDAKAQFSRETNYARAAETNARDRANQTARRKAERVPEAARIKREKDAARSAAYRKRKADEKAAARAVEPLRAVPAPLPAEAYHPARQVLMDWLGLPGRAQQQIVGVRENVRRYLFAQGVLLRMRHELGRNPKPAEFCARLSERTKLDVDRMQAGHLLRQLAKIEAQTEPWLASMTAGDETSTISVMRGDETLQVSVTDLDETSDRA